MDHLIALHAQQATNVHLKLQRHPQSAMQALILKLVHQFVQIVVQENTAPQMDHLHAWRVHQATNVQLQLQSLLKYVLQVHIL
ncbi:hypothetical protein DPMN_115102 [Dreissena polymorpha]|uniref:Uncharacterized protein n=1 Tax=Dreissena polymorpha TaxID=45954 RepID=A0A9D4KLC6_DREPO|nr:hypothetical protein DPMN_115102 [Dreissena polymorpha]